MLKLFAFILGLIFGSFANVLIWRMPKGIKITGRSFCDRCKKKISWFDNIPLLSFTLLMGKCRSCRESISFYHPIIELVSGLIFLLFYLKFGISLEFVFFALIAVILISIFVIDLNNQIIPDELVFSGIIMTFIYLLLINPSLIFSSVLAGISSSLFLLVIHLATKGKGMGLGDVKFAIFGGMLVGLVNIFHWLFYAFLTGAIVGCILVLIGNLKLKSKIVFGPFLVFALILTIFLRM